MFGHWLRIAGVLVLGGIAVACTSAGAGLSNNPLDNIFEPPERQQADRARPREIRTASRQFGKTFEVPVPYAQEVIGKDSGTLRVPGGGANKVVAGRDGVTINLYKVPIAEAAKSIYGDILGLNYLIMPGVEGEVTIQSARPLPRERLARIFENVLQAQGYSITYRDGVYVIGRAGKDRGPLLTRGARGPVVGQRVWLVPLRYVSATRMAKLLQPMVAKGSVRVADDRRDVLMVSGTAAEVASIDRMIRVFDVDIMRGKSFGLYPVRSKSPAALVKELEVVFGDGGMPNPNRIRFVPNQRLGAVLVIAGNPALLRKARAWITRLDRIARATESRVFVYKVENRPPAELAKLLKQILGTGGDTGQRPPRAKPIAPRFDSSGLGAVLADKGKTTPPKAGDKGRSADKAPSAGESELSQAVIVPDEQNKALLIRTTPRNYNRILDILYKLDVPAAQVMLEAVIAEITLNDQLRFGVKWFLQSGKHGFTLSDLASGAVSPVFPGFSYVFESANIQMVLDALSEVTNVNVVSAPSLMVMDNRKAILQIGDQVPIATQASQKPDDPNSPVITKIEMKDTGVIFRVTPQVNDNGQVLLNIEQEVSSAQKTTTSGIDSPTISRRRLATSVLVDDGSVVALGGLIQQRDTVSRKQVPILGNIPVLGAAFRTKHNNTSRTELMIFLRPRVIRSGSDARAIAQEFRRRLHVRPLQPVYRNGNPAHDVKRILR